MTSDLPESMAEQWTPVGTRTGRTSVLVASITAETTVYEPVAAERSLTGLGAGEMPARSLFAVDLTFAPPLSTVGVSPAAAFSTAAPKAKAQFVDTVEDDGLVVEGTRETLEFERDDGTAGRWYVLDASIPVASGTGDDDAAIDAETHVAVWPTETTYGMAGGTLPLSLPDDVAASLEAGAVDPERDRETIAELVRRVGNESYPDEE